MALRKASPEFQLLFIYLNQRWWPHIIWFTGGKFAFGIYDFDGNDTMDAFYLGDCLRALELNPTNALVEKMGGTKKKGNWYFQSIQSIQLWICTALMAMTWFRWEEIQIGRILAHLQWRQERQGYGYLWRFHGVHEVVRQIWKRTHDRSWIVPHPGLFGSVYICFDWGITIFSFFLSFSLWCRWTSDWAGSWWHLEGLLPRRKWGWWNPLLAYVLFSQSTLFH